MAIERVAVIGAGVMGAGIAAHIANAGIAVTLLDIVPKNADNRNVIAETAVARLLKAEPAAFMDRRDASLIRPGNIEDHLQELAEADWIIEAVIERLEIKQSLYRKIETVRKPGSIVSSNTSTLPLAHLSRDLPDRFRRDFLITHFFNPPRYMRLLELVAGPTTAAEAVDRIRDFADRRLGKGVVECRDTAGFIGNRIGVYWLQLGITEAIAMGLTVEQADAVMGTPLGFPKTGIFGLLDLVGLDLIPHIVASMTRNLPAEDAFQPISPIPERVRWMLEQGYTGRKGKGGFYRLNTEGGGRIKESLDLATGLYHPSSKPRLDSIAAIKTAGLHGLLESDDLSGRYAWKVLSRTLAYAATILPELADQPSTVDTAMKLGFNWRQGPFELIDKLGPEWLSRRLQAEDFPLPPLLAEGRSFYRSEQGQLQNRTLKGDYRPVARAPGVLLLEDVKRQGPALAGNASASLWDIGDDVVCLEFHSKMNTLDSNSMALLQQAIERVQRDFRALVIHNEADNFSVGANLGVLLFAVNIAAWDQVETMVREGQETYKALKYAPFPVVAAPSGMALGGGCEILLHCDAIQAHAELYAGLVEVGVGVIPGWGGCKEMLLRAFRSHYCAGGPMPAITQVFETVATARVSKSAADARVMHILAPDDGITMNKSRLLADAKARALALSADYSPPAEPHYQLPGTSARAAMLMALHIYRRQGKASAHDCEVAAALANVLSGGDTDLTVSLSEDDLLALERQSFMRLVRQPATIDRLEHMLETGKPLRN